MVKTVLVNLKRNSYIDTNRVVRQLTEQEQKFYKEKIRKVQNDLHSRKRV